MSTLQFQAPSITFGMADDTMEISSEHGQDLGEDEIDIDIDFTAAQADEDYVLEDATPPLGFDENSLPQPSPARNDYDHMVDDDDGSYSMIDADLVTEETELQMGDRPIYHPRPEQPLPQFSDKPDEQPTPDHQILLIGEDDVSWEQHGMTDNEYADSDLTAHGAAQKALSNGHDRLNERLEGTEIDSFKAVHTKPQSPRDQRPSNPGGESLSTSESMPALDSTHHINGRGDANPQELGHTVAKEPVVPTSERGLQSPPAPEVMVIYQSTEYPLFSIKDTDDIDSFFLSDLATVEKPLVELFDAIRMIIDEDLSVEDELCISVQDLGLEIEENSSAAHDITLGQIITLFDMLQHNDGTEPLRPLCVLLGKRPHFAKRFAFLTASASEGKGLSEIISWGDESEGHRELSGAQDENETNLDLKEPVVEVIERHREGQKREEGSPQILHDDVQTQSPRAGKDLAQNGGSSRREEVGLTSKAIFSEIHLPQSNNTPPTDGYDEDGDIIDYSEDDGDDAHVQADDMTPSAAKLALEGKIDVNEFKGSNEELRPLSTDQTNDGNDLDADGQRHHLSEPVDQDQQRNYVAEDEIHYDDVQNTEQSNHELRRFKTGKSSTVNGETYDTEEYSENGISVRYSPGGKDEKSGEDEIQTNDEVGFEDGEEDSPKTIADVGDETSKDSELMATATHDHAEIDNGKATKGGIRSEEYLQPIDDPELSANTADAKSAEIHDTHEDEIGYDDDDDDDSMQVQTRMIATHGLLDPAAVSTKRARAEQGLDEALIEDNDPKRRRS